MDLVSGAEIQPDMPEQVFIKSEPGLQECANFADRYKLHQELHIKEECSNSNQQSASDFLTNIVIKTEPGLEECSCFVNKMELHEELHIKEECSDTIKQNSSNSISSRCSGLPEKNIESEPELKVNADDIRKQLHIKEECSNSNQRDTSNSKTSKCTTKRRKYGMLNEFLQISKAMVSTFDNVDINKTFVEKLYKQLEDMNPYKAETKRRRIAKIMKS